MTQTEMRTLNAMEAVNLPANLVNRARVMLSADEDDRPDLLEQLREVVEARMKVRGPELEAHVRACTMRASLQLIDAVPRPMAVGEGEFDEDREG